MKIGLDLEFELDVAFALVVVIASNVITFTKVKVRF
jgi:hypothetical protein